MRLRPSLFRLLLKQRGISEVPEPPSNLLSVTVKSTEEKKEEVRK